MSSLDSAASSEGRPALRLLLLGRTGSGRSASGNTLLGRPAFPAAARPRSLTRRCRTQRGAAGGRGLEVTDTPGFFHTDLSPQEVTEEVVRGLLGLAAPGPHALLLTLRPGRHTQEERRALGWLRAVLGPRAPEFTLLLLTGGEEALQGRRPEDFLEESEELREFAESCRGGWHLLDNRGGEQEQEQEQEQVQQLLEKVERMVEENAGGFYSNEMFRDAERVVWEVQEERILGGEKGCEDPGGEEETRSGRREEVDLRRGGREERGGEERRWSSVDDRGRREEEERKREEEAARRKEEREFWAELLTAVGRGAAEGAGLLEKGAGPEGKKPGIGKTLKKVGTMATTPMSITSAARVVGGAVREGGRVLFKHRKALTHK